MPDPASRHRRRLRGFMMHLIAYFGVMIVVVAINFAMSPETAWFVWPMVGWMAPMAVHAAWAMGLFDRSEDG